MTSQVRCMLSAQVSALLLVGIIIVGGALGYWLVRKFVISEDGSVHSGIAGFVKWAMRLVAVTFIFQSTLDTPLAIAAVASCLAICLSITSIRNPVGNSWASGGRTTGKSGRTEFLSRSGKKGSQGTLSNGPRPSSALSGSFIKASAIGERKMGFEKLAAKKGEGVRKRWRWWCNGGCAVVSGRPRNP
ncbi:hypothetical protein RJ639_018850 [Escallonia herrerae]|uniref:Uncharacterized protein n=1 Tax=Escallonia herrerae TaxID=1293975 RepID=A0AA89AIU9_9ASTE|nr:hypothetical protein RJ639_018850 [Escallonia herrerae]